MALTKSDFEKYQVNEVLQRREDPYDALSHQKHCVNELVRCSESGDETGSELFSLLSALSSMYLDPKESKAPFNPQLSFSSPRLYIPDDFSEEQLSFMAEVVCEALETHMRARIADVLWLRKRNLQFARLACSSYLETVDLENLTYYMEAPLYRAMQIAHQLNDRELLVNTIHKAHQFAERQYANGEIADWSRTVYQIAKHSESERESIADQIWQLTEKYEEDGGWAFPTELWLKCADLYKGERSQEALQKAIKSLEKHAEYEAKYQHFPGAQGKIWQALQLQEKMQGKKEQREHLLSLDFKYGKRTHENIPMTNHRIEFDPQITNIINDFALNEMERIKGSTLDVALEKLAKNSHSIKIRDDLFSKRAAVNERAFYFICPIWPAVLQINKEHNEKLVNADELENIFVKCDFIPKESLRTFTYAMLAGLNSDLVAVAHVLPPQIENALRDILRSKDIVTYYTSGKRGGEEKPLSWILEQSEIRETLDGNLLSDLENLLVEKHTGLNLRNKVAHGEWTDEALFLENNSYNPRQSQIMYLWWLALHLCFTIKKDDSGNLIYQST